MLPMDAIIPSKNKINIVSTLLLQIKQPALLYKYAAFNWNFIVNGM